MGMLGQPVVVPRSPRSVLSPKLILGVSRTASAAWPPAPAAAPASHRPPDSCGGPPSPPLFHIQPNTVTCQGFLRLNASEGASLPPSSWCAAPSVPFTVLRDIHAAAGAVTGLCWCVNTWRWNWTPCHLSNAVSNSQLPQTLIFY